MLAEDSSSSPPVITRAMIARQEQVALELYENPPISEDRLECVENGIIYMKGRGWSCRKAAKKAGTTRGILSRACKNGISKQPGPKPFLSEEERVKVIELVEHASLSLNSDLNTPQSFTEIVNEVKKASNTNSFDNYVDEVSQRTLRRYKKECKLLSRTADMKYTTRQATLENIRNPLSLCSVLKSVFEMNNTCRALYMSSDDVCVLLHGWDEKPQVLTAADANKILEESNVVVSSVATSERRRILIFNITLAGDGETICKVIKIADNNFLHLRKKPTIYEMENGLFVVLYHPKLSKNILEQHVYDKCIFRCAFTRRTKLQTEIRDLSSHSSGSPASLSENMAACEGEEFGAVEQKVGNSVSTNALSHSAQERKNAKYSHIIMACDYTHSQSAAHFEKSNEKLQEKELGVTLIKYSAGCSMIASPDEIRGMHAILHNCFKSSSFRYDCPVTTALDELSPSWCSLCIILKQFMDVASFKSVWKCLCNCDAFLDKAFSKVNVRKTFQKSGIVPFNPEVILESDPHFKKLPRNQANFVLNSVEHFASVVTKRGMITEDEFEEHFRQEGLLSDGDNSSTNGGKPSNEMSVNWQRAIIMSHPAYVGWLQEKTALSAPSQDQQVNAGGAAPSKCSHSNQEDSIEEIQRKRHRAAYTAL